AQECLVFQANRGFEIPHDTRRRACPRMSASSRMCTSRVPATVRVAPTQATQDALMQGFCVEALSPGLEPGAASLPCAPIGNQWQPTATFWLVRPVLAAIP